MPSVSMWWAANNAVWNVPGLTVSLPGTGFNISGTVSGPPSMQQRRYTLRCWSTYFLPSNALPATGCKWQSLAIDNSIGFVTGSTRGGWWPFGPWPSTSLSVIRHHRIFIGSKLILHQRHIATPISIYEEEYRTDSQSTPFFPSSMSSASGVLFEIDRAQPLGIELEYEFGFSFTGDGSISMGSFFVIFPGFDIQSVS